MNKNSVFRIVPNIYSDDIKASKDFYVNFLGLKLVMDLGWVITFASEENPSAQITILRNNDKQKIDNDAIFISVEVSDVDTLFQRANELSVPVSYPLTDESWGVRRFFVKDPNGATLNLLTHI